jgi:hypothetical protein
VVLQKPVKGPEQLSGVLQSGWMKVDIPVRLLGKEQHQVFCRGWLKVKTSHLVFLKGW